MKTLHLILKKKWFDMILSGDKTEEYRDITPYYESRFIDARLQAVLEVTPAIPWKEFDTVTFSHGYSKDRPQFVIELKGIEFAYGNENWGATPHVQYFVLKLGKIIEKRLG